MIKLRIDNTDVEVKEGTSVMQAAESLGVEIPAMCFMEGFFVGSLFINLFGTTYEATVACYLCEKDIQNIHKEPIDNGPEELK